jgi:transcriptional regulator with XRE-family HTH domain
MIYKYSDYLKFLSTKIGGAGSRTGLKSKLAQAIGCQQTYLSKVLKGNADFSLEQAIAAANFFELSSEETEFFILLVSHNRASTSQLKQFYGKQISDYQNKMLSVESTTEIKEFLSRENQQIYYSNWYYMAFHIAVSLSSIRNIEDLAKHFDLDRSKTAEITEFLLTTGLVKLDKKRLAPGPTHIHLKKGSPDLLKHHTNWRLKALNSVSKSGPESFHYTVVASLSQSDAKELRAKLVEWVEDFLDSIETSPEETIYCHNLDFFKVL